MQILFLHNNFPAQFGFLGQFLASQGWDVWFGTQRKKSAMQGIKVFNYETKEWDNARGKEITDAGKYINEIGERKAIELIKEILADANNNVDIGDPIEMAWFYYEAGADELIFYDITDLKNLEVHKSLLRSL